MCRSANMQIGVDYWVQAVILQVLIIFPYRAKNINQFAIRNGRSAVPRIGGDNSKYSGFKYLRNIINRKLKLSFQGKRTLFMKMLVTVYSTPFFYLNKIYCIIFGMN